MSEYVTLGEFQCMVAVQNSINKDMDDRLTALESPTPGLAELEGLRDKMRTKGWSWGELDALIAKYAGAGGECPWTGWMETMEDGSRRLAYVPCMHGCTPDGCSASASSDSAQGEDLTTEAERARAKCSPEFIAQVDASIERNHDAIVELGRLDTQPVDRNGFLEVRCPMCLGHVVMPVCFVCNGHGVIWQRGGDERAECQTGIQLAPSYHKRVEKVIAANPQVVSCAKCAMHVVSELIPYWPEVLVEGQRGGEVAP